MGVRRIVRTRPTTTPLARFGRGAGGEGTRYAPVPRHSSFIPHPSSFPRLAFTLVEMLTVIVIIGILASLITAAVIHARAGVKVFTVRKEINDLQQALEAYKIKYGEYPPDFTFLTAMNPNMRSIGQTAVVRHLRNAFPRYMENYPSDAAAWARFVTDIRQYTFRLNARNYYLDPDPFGDAGVAPPAGMTAALDPASALLFWLGGLPEGKRLPNGQLSGHTDFDAGEKWVPAGFNADKASPFKLGLPRTEPFFTFNAERLFALQPMPADPTLFGPLRYHPPSIDREYVYFRARRDPVSGRFEYGASLNATFFACAICGDCVPYMSGLTGDPAVPDTDRPWSDRQKFQIIAAGMDNQFGSGTAWRDLATGLGISNADFDNITSFADGKLEDAMPK